MHQWVGPPDRYPDLNSILRCPRCKAGLARFSDRVVCLNESCVYSDRGFPLLADQPVLIDFHDSIFARSDYTDKDGYVFPRDLTQSSWRSRLHVLVDGSNPIAPGNCDRFIALLKARSRRPRVLIIGGGKIGLGADKLYNDPDVELIGTDVYVSPLTSLVCDGHKLPFDDATFDGVWIQAVLEHVLNPTIVVSEIHRVLTSDGLVYSETPFMQQVHERAYDFTRFTRSGHRFLFRRFEEVDAGMVSGPAIALLWSMRYLLRALGAGERLSRIIVLLFFWIRFLDYFTNSKMAADGAGGLYFLGRRSETNIPASSMVPYYDTRN